MLLAQVEAHLKRRRMPPSRFGREAVGDPKFVFDLRRGRTVGDRTARRVIDYIRHHKADEG